MTGKEPAELPAARRAQRLGDGARVRRGDDAVHGRLLGPARPRGTSAKSQPAGTVEAAHDGWVRGASRRRRTARGSPPAARTGSSALWTRRRARRPPSSTRRRTCCRCCSPRTARACSPATCSASSASSRCRPARCCARSRRRSCTSSTASRTSAGCGACCSTPTARRCSSAGREPKTGGFVQCIPLLIAFDRATGKRLSQWKGANDNEGYVTDLAWHPDGYVIGTTSGQPGQGKLFFWKPGDAPPFFVSAKMPNCHSVARPPDGDRLAVSADEREQQRQRPREGQGRRLPRERVADSDVADSAGVRATSVCRAAACIHRTGRDGTRMCLLLFNPRTRTRSCSAARGTATRARQRRVGPLRRTRFACFSRCASAAFSSASRGSRPSASCHARCHLLRGFASSPMRFASAALCSWTNGLFSSASACVGTVVTSRWQLGSVVSGKSNVVSSGGSRPRLAKMYTLRRPCSAGGDAFHAAPFIDSPSSASGGIVGREARAADAVELRACPRRTAANRGATSASSRRRSARHQRRLPASVFAYSSCFGCSDDCRYVSREQDQSVEVLRATSRPATSSAGEPVEQFRVRRLVAGEAEVVRRAHEALAEVVLPDAVHPHAGRQRVLRVDDPLRQLQAARASSSRRRAAARAAGRARG